MNKYVYLGAKYLFGIFLVLSAVGTAVSIFSGEAMNFSTGYPETAAQDFVAAVIETGWVLKFISVTKLFAGLLILLPKTEKLGVLVAFPYSVGMLLWGVFTAPSHVAIMAVIFILNIILVKKHIDSYRSLWS